MPEVWGETRRLLFWRLGVLQMRDEGFCGCVTSFRTLPHDPTRPACGGTRREVEEGGGRIHGLVSSMQRMPRYSSCLQNNGSLRQTPFRRTMSAPLLFDRFGPVRLCCGKRHFGVVCPDGMVMCSICFERVPESKLSRCADGRLENVCIQCALDESHQASREPDPTPAPEAPAS